MLHIIARTIQRIIPAQPALAHCDGPCGVYDPASARIAAEAALSMTKKMLALPVPDAGDHAAYVAYHNTFSRFTAIKEEQADLAKKELLILWTRLLQTTSLRAIPRFTRHVLASGQTVLVSQSGS